jgi:hypothetical protein
MPVRRHRQAVEAGGEHHRTAHDQRARAHAVGVEQPRRKRAHRDLREVVGTARLRDQAIGPAVDMVDGLAYRREEVPLVVTLRSSAPR